MGIYFAFYGVIVIFGSLALFALSVSKGLSSADETMLLVAVFYFCVIGLDVAWNWGFARRFWAVVVGSLTLHDEPKDTIGELAGVSPVSR